MLPDPRQALATQRAPNPTQPRHRPCPSLHSTRLEPRQPSTVKRATDRHPDPRRAPARHPGFPASTQQRPAHPQELAAKLVVKEILIMWRCRGLTERKQKMTVWENMQKAEAEAAIQNLVIKLEKKRPYSLERIFNTLRSGSRKTQVVRSTSTANQNQHISRTIKTAPNLSKNGQMSSLSGCFRQDL
ncbi:Remorin family protein [Zea mays]|uniref:Remorin family protein n=7 Tax=Zea mays TaxID=4577 RepID=A0A1D6I3K0_MAIZE|nr:Remorin family protein [Zea mays]|eukprot:XP_008652651.2 uncharacterized protein LOC103632686 [Zea mays]